MFEQSQRIVERSLALAFAELADVVIDSASNLTWIRDMLEGQASIAAGRLYNNLAVADQLAKQGGVVAHILDRAQAGGAAVLRAEGLFYNVDQAGGGEDKDVVAKVFVTPQCPEHAADKDQRADEDG